MSDCLIHTAIQSTNNDNLTPLQLRNNRHDNGHPAQVEVESPRGSRKIKKWKPLKQ